MALVKNIAGFEGGNTVGVSFPAPPPKSTNGLFSGIVKLTGAASSFVPGAQAVLMAAKVAISLLPEGGLKDWLSGGPAAFLARLMKVFFGRQYNTGNYVLGERYLDQVEAASGPDSIKTNWNVTEENVMTAVAFFTIVFGVRITDSSDLDALDSGPEAYYLRPDKGDVPRVAVDRACFLKQNYYPISTYNKAVWDLDYFSQYPLLAPIPDPWNVGRLYNGPLPGGGTATNGIILIGEETGLYTDVTGEIKSGVNTGAGATDKKKELLIVGGALAFLYFLFEYQKPGRE